MNERAEKNKLIATKIMELVEQQDFGHWTEHEWERNEDGQIDYFAMSGGFYNGPQCVRCGYSFCVHCAGEADNHDCTVEVPDYFVDAEESEKLVEKLLNDGYTIRISKQGDAYVSILIEWSCLVCDAEGTTKAEAIAECAYQLAVMEEE